MENTANFKKVVRIGMGETYRGRSYSIFCKIEYTDGNLSISGVEGPTVGGNALGACGQINMHLRDNQASIKLASGWSRTTLARFFEVWERWHLNDMKAGTPEQETHLKEHAAEWETYKANDKSEYYPSHYTWACKVLSEAGLNPTAEGYQYGSEWLREEVPSDVIEFLHALPSTDRQPAWV